MAVRTCYGCVYMRVDPDEWLRQVRLGEPLMPRCANHPLWPGQLHEVPGTPCVNFRAHHPKPDGAVKRIPLTGGPTEDRRARKVCWTQDIAHK